MKILIFILAALLDVVPFGQAFMKQLQPRDSILIADQIQYGFEMDSVDVRTVLALPDLSRASNDTLTLVGGWQLDTLKAYGPKKARKAFHIRGSIILAPFEEGTYQLPALPVQRTLDGKVDTLVFEGLEMEVKTMPVDTTTFEIHDIKGQITYPVTFAELAPWIGGSLLLLALIAFAVWYIRRRIARKRGEDARRKDPPHIVALRELDKYRSDKYWAPERQKAFYSGITDALKTYMEARFGVDAPEMTTAELFAALKDSKDITPDLFSETKDLFECADFVKFAKHTAPDEDNAKALPTAVRFVTSTYQVEVEASAADGGEAAGQ